MIDDSLERLLEDYQLDQIQPKFRRFNSQENPLSANTFLLEGNEHNYLFDVGASDEALDFVSTIPECVVIISHFHRDHAFNLRRHEFPIIYQNKIEEPIMIEDGFNLNILPLTSSHAKGSLMLEVDETYLLVGDGLGPGIKGEELMYNTQMLHETIKTLKATNATRLLLGHDREILDKEAEIERLEEIYAKREKNSPYIKVDSFHFSLSH